MNIVIIALAVALVAALVLLIASAVVLVWAVRLAGSLYEALDLDDAEAAE